MLEPISLGLVASGTFWLLEKTGDAIFSKALGDGAFHGACALLKRAETAPSDGNCLLDGFRRAHARTGKLLIERAYRTQMGDTVSARWTGGGPTDLFNAGSLYYEKLLKAKASENPYDHPLGQSPLKLEAPTNAIRAALQPLSNLGTAGGADAQPPGVAPCLHAVQAFAIEEAVAATGSGKEVRASIEGAFADYAPIFANEIAQEIQDNAPFRAIFNARQLQEVRRDIADLPEAITQAVAQSLGQHLSDLIESLRSQLKEQLESIESLVRGRPDLDAMLSPDSFENRFVFTSRSTPLVGRENELAAFRAWLQSDEKFSWQILAGSGGVGKSRLALELVRMATPLFEAGFYRATQAASAWHDWQPKQPTLIVVDYPAAKIETTRELLHQLQRGVLDEFTPSRYACCFWNAKPTDPGGRN